MQEGEVLSDNFGYTGGESQQSAIRFCSPFAAEINPSQSSAI